jgi:MraZ protein
MAAAELLIGEFARTLDERFRLAIPPELLDPLLASGSRLVLAKERAGCLSLWPAAIWKPRIDAAVDVVRSKMEAGLLAQRVGQVQELGRLLSTRQRVVTLAAGGARGVSRVSRGGTGRRRDGGGRGCVRGAVAARRLDDIRDRRDARLPPADRRIDRVIARGGSGLAVPG